MSSLLSVRAPLKLIVTYNSTRPRSYASLEDFVREDDRLVFGRQPHHPSSPSLHGLRDLIDIQITNAFPCLRDFESHLEELNLLDNEHLRPGWDAYFMVRF
jgi:dCMP deaminase